MYRYGFRQSLFFLRSNQLRQLLNSPRLVRILDAFKKLYGFLNVIEIPYILHHILKIEVIVTALILAVPDLLDIFSTVWYFYDGWAQLNWNPFYLLVSIILKFNGYNGKALLVLVGEVTRWRILVEDRYSICTEGFQLVGDWPGWNVSLLPSGHQAAHDALDSGVG